MLKKELLKLIETLKDEDNVDETISKSELGKALLSSGLTLDAFKAKLNEPDFKAYMDSEKDTHFNKALETWKKNNLQKLVDDEYYKKHPGEKKDPVAIELAELKKKYEESERARKLETSKAAITKQLTDKKLPTELADFIVNEDETVTNTNLSSLEKIFKNHDAALKADFIKGNIYVPGSHVDDGGKGDSSIVFAKKLAGGAKTDKSIEEARDSYYK